MSVRAMIKKSILESDMYNQSISLSTLLTIIVDMAIALIIGILIYEIYKRYFLGVIYSRTFALTLVGMTVLTCMVTLAISTNIVISLGMVGALSIVRYRTAIKEPLDIMYIFWAITMGITIGASMYLLAAVGMVFMLAIVMIMHSRKDIGSSYIMIVHSKGDVEKDVTSKLGGMSYTIKSKTVRQDNTELTIQLDCDEKKMEFADEIRGIGDVNDVTLIRYNGEYHG
ncbi:MAG: DUF4956 domain-containing protein [Lachnospiraceae bacterium]|nr:DUF4956 domain-containing protein [Lachnospiraceae bacterium]